jgi:hypothetical protein
MCNSVSQKAIESNNRFVVGFSDTTHHVTIQQVFESVGTRHSNGGMHHYVVSTIEPDMGRPFETPFQPIQQKSQSRDIVTFYRMIYTGLIMKTV